MQNNRKKSVKTSVKGVKTYFSKKLLTILQKLHDLFYESDSKGISSPDKKFEYQIYWRLAKLMEESGELAEAIHAYFKYQRKEKYAKNGGNLGSKEHIAEEIVDVIIVVALLAPMLGIDLNKTLEKKIKKIRTRMLEKYGVDILKE